MIDGMARKTHQYYGKYLVDFFRCERLSESDVRNMVSIEHPEYLEQVKKLGRGVLITTAHFGNWELGGAALTALGCDIHAVEMPQRNAKLNNLLQNQRAARGIKLLPMNSAISIMKCLKRGGMVAVLADRDFSPRNDRVPFFGLPARMPVGPAWLSHRTGAAILPSFLFRLEDDTFLLRFYPPILPEQEGSVQAIRRKMVSVLEREIGERPCQWFIFEDFWKTSGQTWHGEPME
jgi:KDO2-lipid IV(A) lauroyltransferase